MENHRGNNHSLEEILGTNHSAHDGMIEMPHMRSPRFGYLRRLNSLPTVQKGCRELFDTVHRSTAPFCGKMGE
jgi:hypothetical protein